MHEYPTIYALSLPSNSNYRYVGMCVYGSTHRLGEHVWLAKRGSTLPVHVWIRKHSYKIVVHDLEILDHRANLAAAEIRWIAQLKSEGYKLLNATDGGDGLVNPSVETREKMRQSQLAFYASAEGIRNRKLRSLKERARRNHPSQKLANQEALRNLYASERGQTLKAQISASVQALYAGSDGEALRLKASEGGKQGAIIGHHRRWHEARNVVKPGCQLCEASNV